MGRRIIALVTPKGLRSREPRKNPPPQRTEKHQKESQVPSVVTSASSEGGTAQHIRDVAALGWGDKSFSKPSPNVAVFSPLHQSDKAAGCCRRAARAGKPRLGGRCSLRGWEILRAKADLHRPAGSSQPRLLLGKTFPNPAGRNGAFPHRTVPVFQSWGRLWGPGIPASCPRKGGSVGSCQLRTQEILGLSLLSIFLVHPGLLPGNLPHCFLLFWKLGGCKRQGCCSKGRLAVLSVQQGSPGP